MTVRPDDRFGRLAGAILLGLAIVSGAVASCDGGGARSLVQLEVTGDQAYPHVQLVVTANGVTEKTFPDVSFDQVIPVSIGLYLPASVSGTVTFVGTATGGQCLRGSGTAIASGVTPGVVLGTPIALRIERLEGCVDGGTDGGSPDSAGTGGAPGTGTGGAGLGSGGGPIEGAGGAIGSGGGIGSGGAIGSGGGIGSGGAIGSGGSGAGGVLAGTGGRGTGGVAIGTGGRGTGGAGIGGAPSGTGGAGSGGSGTGGDADAGSGPCAGLCANPVALDSTIPFHGSDLGVDAFCGEATPAATLQGIGCANFMSRTMTINGLASPNCSSVNSVPPPKRAGGYCFQVSAGQPSYASFYYY